MADKADYQEVPDVEAGVLPEPKVNPRETYPEANEQEARLLGYLDEVIQMPNPKITLPRIQVAQVEGAPTTFADLVESVKIPTFVFLGTVSASVLAVLSGLPLVQLIFPYVACVAEFVGTIPSLTERFTKQSDRGFGILEEKEGSLNATVDSVTFKVTSCVDEIQSLLMNVLQPIRPKLDAATKAETLLKKYDENIDIPDPSDIERELDGCTDEVQATMAAVKTAVDIKKCIPLCFRSRENFNLYAIYPVLFVFLVMQLVGVYQTSQRYNASAVDSETVVHATRYLRGTLQESATSESVVANATSWYPVWVSVQVYVTALVQIVLGFLMSQAAAIAAVLNIGIKRINDQANRAIDTTGATQVFNTYLTDRMIDIRKKLLKLIASMTKIDNLMEKAGIAKDLVSAASAGQAILDSVSPNKTGGFRLWGPGSPFDKSKK